MVFGELCNDLLRSANTTPHPQDSPRLFNISLRCLARFSCSPTGSVFQLLATVGSCASLSRALPRPVGKVCSFSYVCATLSIESMSV